MQTQIVLTDTELRDAIRAYLESVGTELGEQFAVEFKATVAGTELTNIRAIAVTQRPAPETDAVNASGQLAPPSGGPAA